MTHTKRVAEAAERLAKITAGDVWTTSPLLRERPTIRYWATKGNQGRVRDLIRDIRLLAAHVAKGNLTARKRKGSK